MTKRPYEILIRFAKNSTVSGASIRTITTVEGMDIESDPSPLSTDSVDFVDFATAFAADAIITRDAAIKERDLFKTRLESAMAKLIELSSWDLRMIDPNAWRSRLTDDELFAVITLTSKDAIAKGFFDALSDSRELRKEDSTYRMSLDHPNAVSGIAYLSGKTIPIDAEGTTATLAGDPVFTADRATAMLADSREDEQ